MEGREHSGVILKYVSSGDAAGAQAWEEAFKGGADPSTELRGIAFRKAPGYEMGDVSHVAIYETTSQDAAAAIASVGQDGEVVSYTKIAEHGPVAEGVTKGVVLVFTDCDDPAEEDGYNEWYTGHLHHTVENMDLCAATRYVSDDPSRTISKYLAIYETLSDDPARVQKDGLDWWMSGNFEGPKGMVLRAEVPFARID